MLKFSYFVATIKNIKTRAKQRKKIKQPPFQKYILKTEKNRKCFLKIKPYNLLKQLYYNLLIKKKKTCFKLQALNFTKKSDIDDSIKLKSTLNYTKNSKIKHSLQNILL